MKSLSASLPVESGHHGGTQKGIIRYDPAHTTICIEDFVTFFMLDEDLVEAISKGFGRQAWMKHIKKMAVEMRCYTEVCRMAEEDDEFKSWGDVLAMFEHLEVWAGWESTNKRNRGVYCSVFLMKNGRATNDS